MIAKGQVSISGAPHSIQGAAKGRFEKHFRTKIQVQDK
jgi:hypothetical protein